MMKQACVFQNNTATSHKASIVQKLKADYAIRTIDWPSQSPDLFIVENIWAYVQDKLYRIRDTLRNADDVQRASQRL